MKAIIIEINKLKKLISCFVICMGSLNANAYFLESVDSATVISESQINQETIKYEIECKSVDNMHLISVFTKPIAHKVDYLIIDSRGAVLGGGVITKSVTKIALKDYPKGKYSIKFVSKNYSFISTILI